MEQKIAQVTMFHNSFGRFILVETSEGVLRLMILRPGEKPNLVGDLTVEEFLAEIGIPNEASNLIEKIIHVDSSPLSERISKYLEGAIDEFIDVPVVYFDATPFQKKVYSFCRQIPHGEVRTYGQLASEAGSPSAARAVGNFMAQNRVPLIIPCHRVVPANGPIGNYSGGEGSKTKKRLLAMESKASRLNGLF